VINWRRSSVASLSRWASTFVYNTMGVMQRVARVCLRQLTSVMWLSVVYCPPLPYWSETQFNSTNNDFLSVVTYWCNDGYAFKGYSSKPGNETVLSSMCIASKQWYPAVLDCQCTLRTINQSIC